MQPASAQAGDFHGVADGGRREDGGGGVGGGPVGSAGFDVEVFEQVAVVNEDGVGTGEGDGGPAGGHLIDGGGGGGGPCGEGDQGGGRGVGAGENRRGFGEGRGVDEGGRKEDREGEQGGEFHVRLVFLVERGVSPGSSKRASMPLGASCFTPRTEMPLRGRAPIW